MRPDVVLGEHRARLPAVQAWLHEGFGASGLFKHPARFGKALVADSAGLRHAASSPAGKS